MSRTYDECLDVVADVLITARLDRERRGMMTSGDPVWSADADALPDDDPDVVEGMRRLAELREIEHETPDLQPPL